MRCRQTQTIAAAVGRAKLQSTCYFAMIDVSNDENERCTVVIGSI